MPARKTETNETADTKEVVDNKEAVDKSEAADKNEAAETEEAVKEKDTVRIKLFKDNGEYKDDLTIGLNGKMYKIQRGVEVEVPKGVAEIIKRSMESDQRTAALISELESQYEAAR